MSQAKTLRSPKSHNRNVQQLSQTQDHHIRCWSSSPNGTWLSLSARVLLTTCRQSSTGTHTILFPKYAPPIGLWMPHLLKWQMLLSLPDISHTSQHVCWWSHERTNLLSMPGTGDVKDLLLFLKLKGEQMQTNKCTKSVRLCCRQEGSNCQRPRMWHSRGSED